MPRPWTADEVLELGREHQAACVLAAAVDLDVFAALADGPHSAADVAAVRGTDVRATTILLDALVSLALLSKRADEYHASADVIALLTDTGAQSVLAMARHQANCLRRWAQLPQVVRNGLPATRTPSVRGATADQAAFIEGMKTVSLPLLGNVIESIRPLRFRHLLDVGGASGTWTIALLREVPGATATLFDLPDVLPMARERLADAGMADRVTLAPGDFYTDPLPAGADFVWLGAIVHQNSREQNRDLFAKAHAALETHGVVMIRDIVMDHTRTRPPAGAMFAVNMLVNTPGGSTYTFLELREDLLAAGFADPTLVCHGDGMDSIVRASKG